MPDQQHIPTEGSSGELSFGEARDEQHYRQMIEDAKTKALTNGWLLRYCIEYEEAVYPTYEYTVDPVYAFNRYYALLREGKRGLECYAEFLEPESLDIEEPLTLLKPQRLRPTNRVVPRDLRYLQETLRRRIRDMTPLLLEPLSEEADVRWQEAERLCATLHELLDQMQRIIVKQGELPRMSAAQTVGPIPCVFASPDECNPQDGVQVYFEVASDAVVHGLSVYIHTDAPGAQTLLGDATAGLKLEHYQGRVQVQLFDELNGPGSDQHWVAPAERTLGGVRACREREQRSPIVLIFDTSASLDSNEGE